MKSMRDTAITLDDPAQSVALRTHSQIVSSMNSLETMQGRPMRCDGLATRIIAIESPFNWR
jgi:hypothetical protein